MEKLLLMEGLMEMLEENGVHYPENQLPLARMKDLLKNKSLLGWEKALPTSSIQKTEKNRFY